MPGAPKGNHNALRHGFYSRQFTEVEKSNLDLARPGTLDEITCLREHATRINTWLLNQDPSTYDDRYFTAVDTLARLMIAIGTLQRTQAILTGTSSNIEKSIEDAVLSQQQRWTLA